MSNLISELRGRKTKASGQISLDEWASWFSFNGLNYPVLQQTLVGGGKQQEMLPSYTGFSDMALKANGIVFACVVARMLVFSEATFKYRPLGSYTSNDLFGGQALGLLEKPWPRATSSDLLRRMSLDEQLAGNSYIYREDSGTLRVARPDFMTIVLGSRSGREDFMVGDLDTEVIGYIYRPPDGNIKPLLPEQVAHFMPVPDPIFPWRGMSWLQPVVEEIQADGAMTVHKRQFFNNGATPNLVVTMDPSVTKEAFDEFVEAMDEGHRGALNAYKTLYLAGGADAKVVGANMQQLDFKVTQSHGEVRICNAAHMPPILAGVSEGLDSATYSNYGLAKKAWGDMTLRPLWRAACDALATICDDPPPGGRLWYDDRIPYLAEDQAQAAEIQQQHAATLKSLIDAGFKPDTAIKAIQSGDFTQLVHTGLYSVQLQPPGTTFTPNATPPASGKGKNGNGNGNTAQELIDRARAEALSALDGSNGHQADAD